MGVGDWLFDISQSSVFHQWHRHRPAAHVVLPCVLIVAVRKIASCLCLVSIRSYVFPCVVFATAAAVATLCQVTKDMPPVPHRHHM